GLRVPRLRPDPRLRCCCRCRLRSQRQGSPGSGLRGGAGRSGSQKPAGSAQSGSAAAAYMSTGAFGPESESAARSFRRSVRPAARQSLSVVPAFATLPKKRAVWKWRDRAMAGKKLNVVVTRRLPEAVETRMSELFNVRLRESD